MKVHCALEMTDTDRRRVRAAIGRGGVATRKEIRIFAERAIRRALETGPEPKTRQRPAPAASTPKAMALEQLRALPDDTMCARCGRTKADHGRMGFSCPPRPGQRPGGRFAAAYAVS
jgi:hypothetical protein